MNYSLPGIIKVKNEPTIIMGRIFESIEAKTGVTHEQLRKKDRHKDIVYARHLFCLLAKRCSNYSLKQIGELIGHRDHTSTIHSIRTAQDLIDTDDNYKNLYESIKSMVC